MELISSAMETEHLWQQILPANIYVSVGTLNDTFLPLTYAELESMGMVSHNRLMEIQAGRTLAKRALAKIDIVNVNIVKNKLTGAPMWPESTVGSITHTGDLANSHVAVAIAKKSEIPLLGIDAELGGHIHPSLWKLFLSEGEFIWLNNKSAVEKCLLVRKIWALKEAAIKASSHMDMISWRVSQKILSSDEFELSFDGACGVEFFVGKAVCHDNITLAVVYAKCNSDHQLNS